MSSFTNWFICACKLLFSANESFFSITFAHSFLKTFSTTSAQLTGYVVGGLNFRQLLNTSSSNVLLEVLHGRVLVLVQTLSHSSKVHRDFDLFIVPINNVSINRASARCHVRRTTISLRIHRLSEYNALWHPEKNLQNIPTLLLVEWG